MLSSCNQKYVHTYFIARLNTYDAQDLRIYDGFSLLLDTLPLPLPPAPIEHIDIFADSESDSAWGGVAAPNQSPTPALSIDGEGDEVELDSNSEPETPEEDAADQEVDDEAASLRELPIVAPAPGAVEQVDDEDAAGFGPVIEGLPIVTPTPGTVAHVREGRSNDDVIVAAIACYFGGVVLAALILGGRA